VIQEIVSREDPIGIQRDARRDAIEPRGGELALGFPQTRGKYRRERAFVIQL
jgi:hypothetical protein